MKLRRQLSQALAFKSESTAIKILYCVKDLSEMNKTDKIYIQEKLAQELSKAISHVLKYEKYQELPEDNKDEIKLFISKELYEQSKNYPSISFIFYSESSPYNRFASSHDKIEDWRDKGLEYNYDFIRNYAGELEYSKYEPREITFPIDLFLNQTKLRKAVVSAIKAKYSNILSDTGIYYSGVPIFLQTAGASIHSLFSNGSGTKPLVEIIAQYLDKDSKEQQKQNSPK